MAGSQKSIYKDGLNNKSLSSAKAIAALLTMEGSPEQFLTELLATQCRLAKADAALLLRSGPAERTEVLAAYPQPGDPTSPMGLISRLEKPFRKALKRGEPIIVREPREAKQNGGSHRYLIIFPLENRDGVPAAAAFRVRAQRRERLLLTRARLETTSFLVDHRELQGTIKTQGESIHRLRCVLEVLDRVNQPTRFLAVAMALCNEIGTRFGCIRVSLGVLKGRSVQVQAMSHTDTFSREMQLVQAIEAAMEECFDQDLEVTHPCADKAVVVSRAAARLSKRHGPSAVLSVPIRQGDSVSAVITLERQSEQPFDHLSEIETLRLICDLCAPRLLDLCKSDRWFGARMLSEGRHLMGRVLGHEHTWMKLCAAVIFSLIMLSSFVRTDFRIKVPFTFKAKHQQAVVAPFDSFSKSVQVEPGDKVEVEKTILGTLETAELRLKLSALKAEQLEYRKQMTTSMRDRRTAEAQIAAAEVEKIGARISIIEKNISQATLLAPISGWIISENRKQLIGAPVKAGDILFEIVRIDSLRAELLVPARSIADISEGQTGTLASVGHPDKKIGFTIEMVNPIAEVVQHQNVFRIRARISEHMEWMRPGMEGQARVSAGKKTYLWIVSHGLVNWLRMKLWL